MNELKARAYYARYQDVIMRHGNRCVKDCYKNPSQRKKYAENRIAMEVYENGGYGYTVISYNTHMFTCGYLYQHDGATYFVIHTPTGRGVMLVKED